MKWDVCCSMKRIITKYEVAVQGVLGMLPRIYDADTPLVHDETKHATSRSPKSTDDFIERPTCYDTFATVSYTQLTLPTI